MLVAHLNELKKQADEQLASLAACRPQLDPTAHQHHDRAVKLISKAHRVLEMMLQDPDLADLAFASNFYIAKGEYRCNTPTCNRTWHPMLVTQAGRTPMLALVMKRM